MVGNDDSDDDRTAGRAWRRFALLGWRRRWSWSRSLAVGVVIW